jgi:ABC-type transport system involved in multi-copper enzyme maturation permease subunit
MAHHYRLLVKGRDIIQSYKDFTKYLLEKKTEERKNERLDKEIRTKTLENLNRSIFKQKHAIWFFLANLIVTIAVALLTAYLVFKFGWK